MPEATTLNLKLRTAAYADAEPIIALDPATARDRAHMNFIHQVVSDRTCFVAHDGGELVGYGVLQCVFFGHGLVTKLFVVPPHRRRGVGAALLRYMEKQCPTLKLFVSTNESNRPMQQLLRRLEYIPSGRVENLDDNDAELFFFKRLEPTATRKG